MGNSKSTTKNNYIKLTLIQNNKNVIISGFVENKLDLMVVKGTTVKMALDNFNKFRRPNNRIYCIFTTDYEKIINDNMDVYIILV